MRLYVFNNEHQGITEQDRKAIFDISARCDDGRTLIFEVQNASQEHFRKRAVYYTSELIEDKIWVGVFVFRT